MKTISLLTSYLLILIVFFVASCSTICNQKSQSDKVEISKKPTNNDVHTSVIAENRSIITASVVEITLINDYRFFLRLRILESNPVTGYKNFGQVNDTINVYPNFIRLEGQVDYDYSVESNKHLLAARVFNKGDTIIVTAYKTNHSNSNWSMIDWGK